MRKEQVPGVGATDELSLRVSVATLSRVIFPSPEAGQPRLALEYKATVLPSSGAEQVMVKAQPFGGAVRILNDTRLKTVAGKFHFDSQRSRSEADLRIFIRPSVWEGVRDFCLHAFGQENDAELESNPTRELIEEFEDTLGIVLRPSQYEIKPVGSVLENEPVPTWNVHASSYPTVRIYRIFETRVLDPDLCRAMEDNSQAFPSNVLRRLALENLHRGKRGRANAMLVASMQSILYAYQALPAEMRGKPVPFEDTLLDGNVPAILEGLSVPKYRRLYG